MCLRKKRGQIWNIIKKLSKNILTGVIEIGEHTTNKSNVSHFNNGGCIKRHIRFSVIPKQKYY